MSRFIFSSLVLVAFLSFFAGCHSGGDSSADTASATSTPSTRPIPPDSIFAKVTMGEDRDQVFATIGKPDSTSGYITGKSFIPFHEYSGGDEHRLVAHYKGVGTITFSNNSAYTSSYSVEDISYDPNEPGY